MCSSPLLCYLVPLRLKYLSPNPIFEKPQLAFVPERDWARRNKIEVVLVTRLLNIRGNLISR